MKFTLKDWSLIRLFERVNFNSFRVVFHSSTLRVYCTWKKKTLMKASGQKLGKLKISDQYMISQSLRWQQFLSLNTKMECFIINFMETQLPLIKRAMSWNSIPWWLCSNCREIWKDHYPQNPPVSISTSARDLTGMLIITTLNETVPDARNSPCALDKEYAQWFMEHRVVAHCIFIDEIGYNIWTRHSFGRAACGVPAVCIWYMDSI